jgi:membrane protein DedA with SNARE-associated domain
MQQATISTLTAASPPVSASEVKRKGSWFSWVGSAVIVVAIIAPLAMQRYLEFDPALIATFGYAAVFILGFVGSITLFLPIPVLGLVFVGANTLNPLLIAFAAAAGITLGMAACYMLGKAGHKMAKRAEPSPGDKLYRLLTRMVEWYKGHVTVASFLMAATPNPMFDYAGYLAGLAQVSQTRFLLATFAGKMAQSLGVALLGYYAFEQISALY